MIDPMNFLPDTFRIVSWNMQGAYGTEKGQIKDKLSLLHEYMRDEQVVAICLQECGDLFGWWQGYKELADIYSEERMGSIMAKKQEKREQLLERFGAIGKEEDYLKIHQDWSDPVMFPQGRCSVGILVRKRFYTGAKITLLDLKRPIIGVRLYGFNNREPFFLYSIHVPYEERNPIYIKDALEYISNKFIKEHGYDGNGSWLCAGDFNFSPDSAKTGLQTFASYIRRPDELTTNGNEYDYCYLGGTYLPLLGCSVHVQQFQYSDHRPVHFLFTPRYVINRHAERLALQLKSNRSNLYINGDATKQFTYAGG